MRREALVPISAATLDKLRKQQARVREQYPAETAAYLSQPAPRTLPVDGLRLVPAQPPQPARISAVPARHLQHSAAGVGHTVRDHRRDAPVTLAACNQLVGIDLGGDQPREVARFPTVRQPNTVTVGPATGRVFVACRTEGTLQLIGPPGRP